MTEIYLVRHGYSKANELDIFLGQKNVDLTEKGRIQAEKVSEYLKNYDITKIYSSDLDRAVQTATPLSKLKNIPINTRENVREIEAGEWDYLTFKEISEKYPNDWILWGVDICNSYCVGGETFSEVQERAYSEMVKIAKECDGKAIAVFSHGTTIKSFICKVLGVTDKEANDLPYPGNASTTKLIFNDGKFTVEYFSKNDYLGDLATNLSIK